MRAWFLAAEVLLQVLQLAAALAALLTIMMKLAKTWNAGARERECFSPNSPGFEFHRPLLIFRQITHTHTVHSRSCTTTTTRRLLAVQQE